MPATQLKWEAVSPGNDEQTTCGKFAITKRGDRLVLVDLRPLPGTGNRPLTSYGTDFSGRRFTKIVAKQLAQALADETAGWNSQ